MCSIVVAGYALIQFNKTRADFMTTGETVSTYPKETDTAPVTEGVGLGIKEIIKLLIGGLLSPSAGNDWMRFWPFLLIAIISIIIIQLFVYGVEKQMKNEDGDDVGFFDISNNIIQSGGLSLTVISPIIMLLMNA